MNDITMKLQADNLIRLALQEDITSEDVSTNAVMPTVQMGGLTGDTYGFLTECGVVVYLMLATYII